MASRIPLVINNGQVEQLQSGDTLGATLTGLSAAVNPGGRLTLVSGDPLPSSDQTAKTTIYYTPYLNSFISLYSSGVWTINTFTEKSVAVPSTTNTPFDVFGYLSAGDLALETINWTNDTTRATALTTQDGFLVKSGDATRLYLGTGRTTGSSGQCEDSATKRYLVNRYNREERQFSLSLTGSGYTYSSTTVRQTNATAGNKVEMVVGWANTVVQIASTQYLVSNTTTAVATCGVGFDVTNAINGRAIQFELGIANAGVLVGSSLRTFPSVGYHAANAVEKGSGSGTQTWFANGSDRGLVGFIIG